MNSDRHMRGLSVTAVLLTGLALGGCAATHSNRVGEIDPAAFGEANRQTYAAMIVNPDPQYSEPMATSAEHAAAAAERYREDEVKQPEAPSSTEGLPD